MKNVFNNSYLKHQMKILAQHEGVTVEAREKAFAYVAKKMHEMAVAIHKLEDDLQNACDEIQTLTNELEIAKKDLETEKLYKKANEELADTPKKKSAKKTKKA